MNDGIHLSLNTGALGLGELPLEKRIAIAKSNGFAALDLSLGGLSEDQARAIGHQVTASNLRAGSFGLPLNINAPDAEFEVALPKVAALAPVAAAAGSLRTGCYMLPASNTRDYAANLEWYLSRYRRLVAILAPHGIQLGIEFLGEHLVAKCGQHPFIWDLPGMRALLDAIGPGAGVIFDLFHWYCSGGTADTLAGQIKGMPITCVHLNDAVPGRSPLEQIDNDRRLPGETGIIDARGAIRVLRDLGIEAPAIVEPFKPWTERFAKMPPEEACAQVARAARSVLE